MTCRVLHTSVDCVTAYELSEWWKRVRGYVDVDGDLLRSEAERASSSAPAVSGTPLRRGGARARIGACPDPSCPTCCETASAA